jgi:hypothetical protein
MQRRALCLGGLGPLLATPGQAASPAPVVLRVSERQQARGVAPHSYGLNRAVCLAVEQMDPGLRFAWTRRAMSETAIVDALSHHRLDLDWDLVATPRRRSHLAFLEGPALTRHRLQLAAHSDDPLNLSDLAELRRAAAQNTLTAARSSVAGEFLDTIPDMRWLALDGDESPQALLRHGRWALMPSHLVHRPDPPPHARPRPWRWMPWVLQDEPVHGAVSLAVPASTRLRLVQALRRLAQEGELAALRHRHGRL